MKTDIEIARAATKKPILDIGAKLGIPPEHLLPYGHDKAKIGQDFIASVQGRPNGKLNFTEDYEWIYLEGEPFRKLVARLVGVSARRDDLHCARVVERLHKLPAITLILESPE